MAYKPPTPPGGSPVSNLTHPPKPAPKKKGGGPTAIKLAPGGDYSPPSKGASSVDAAMNAIAPLKGTNQYYHQFISIIKNAADQWSIDPVQLLQTIVFEGGTINNVNSAGAKGLAQIVDTSVDPGLNKARYNEFIKQYGGFDPFSPTWAINYMAWRMDGGIRHYPTLDDWYRGTNGDKTAPRGYDPHFTGDSRGPGPSAIGKGNSVVTRYTPTIPQSTVQQGGKTSSTGNAVQGFKDPYMVAVTVKGTDGKMHLKKLKKVFSVDSIPKGTMNFDGAPMRLSDWNQLARQLEQYFVSYTGGRPSADMLYKYVQNGWSPYSLTVALANSKKFVGSPIYKSQAPTFQEAAKDVTAPGSSVPQALIRSAIVNNWTTQEFQAILRKDPGYLKSNEFNQNTTTLLNVHQSIMGIPDQGAINGLHQAALAGWTPDQYASYLRSQPQYTSSPEYQYKTLSFLQGLGLITGQNPVLKKGIAPDVNPNPNLAGNLPDSSRLPAGSLSRPEDTVATYDG